MSKQSYEQQENYAQPNILASIPSEISNGQIIIPLSCSNLSQQVVSNSSSVTNGGSMYIQLPTNNMSCIRPGSAYLRFDLSVTCGATGGVFFNCPLGDASALVDRIQLSAAGESIDINNNYSFTNDMIVLNKCSSNWINSVGYATSNYSNNDSGTGAFFQASQANYNTSTKSGHYIVPLNQSIFSGSDQAFPLYLLQSQVVVQIDFQSNPSKIFYGAAGQSLSGIAWTVSNLSLVYEAIFLDEAYVKMVKEDLDSGSSFLYKATSWLSQLQSVTGTYSILYSLGVKSLRAMTYTYLPSTFATTTSNWFSAEAQSYFYLYLDSSRLINQLGVMDVTKYASVVFAESRKAWVSHMSDCPYGANLNPLTQSNGLITTFNPLTGNNANNPYLLYYFCGAQSCSVFKEGTGLYSGSPCQQAKLEGSVTGTVNMLMMPIFDIVIEISRGGVLRLIK